MSGISMAFNALAKRMVDKNVTKDSGQVNIIGATPLDFSINGSVNSMKKLLMDNGFHVIATWAMGDTLDEIRKPDELQSIWLYPTADWLRQENCKRHLGHLMLSDAERKSLFKTAYERLKIGG